MSRRSSGSAGTGRVPRSDRRAAAVSIVGALLLAAACAVPAAEIERALFEVVPVPDGLAPETVEPGPRNTLWLGSPSSMHVVSPDGAVVDRFRLPGGGGPWRLSAWTDRETVLLSEPGRAAAIERADATVRWLRLDGRPDRPVLADFEWIYEILDNSAVYGIDPRTGEVRWAWARLGHPTAAAILAPEGDRMYQLLDDGGDAILLLRNLENGRIVGRSGARGTPLTVAAGVRGGVFVVSSLGRQLVVTRLRPVPGAVDTEWVTGISTEGGQRVAAAAVSPMGDQLAVRAERHVYVLDARSGEELGAFEGRYDDVGYDEAGRLYVVRDGRLLRRRAGEALSGPRLPPRATRDTSADSGARRWPG